MILDPPSFSHSSDGRWALEKDYPGIVSRCLRVLEPGGWLIAASNHGALSPRAFHGLVRDGAWKAKASLQLIHEGSAAPDFPARVDFPEARFLKFGVWRRE